MKSELPSAVEKAVAPDKRKGKGNDGPDESPLEESLIRLKEVQRRCADDSGGGEGRALARQSLNAVILDLDASLGPGAIGFDVGLLDFRLAEVEELFESAGSRSLARVISSIRDSLPPAPEDDVVDEEPPPPRRYLPPPAAAAPILRRPRPQQREKKNKAAKDGRTKGARWPFWLAAFVGVSAAVAFLYSEGHLAEFLPGGKAKPAVGEKTVLPRPMATDESRLVPEPPSVNEEFEFQEETLANFTLEIRLCESALYDGDVTQALKHFAAAAAIDRQHRRVTVTGKLLIATMLREADAAYNRGERAFANRKVDDARSLARGLLLDNSVIDRTARKDPAMNRFEDIDPRDEDALRRAVGHPVRLTLRTKDVIYAHLQGVEDGVLQIEVYAGVEGVEFSPTILATTVRELRIFDAEIAEEIAPGD